jgi:hypothetical protein
LGADPVALPRAGSVLDRLTFRHLSSPLVLRTLAGSVLDWTDVPSGEWRPVGGPVGRGGCGFRGGDGPWAGVGGEEWWWCVHPPERWLRGAVAGCVGERLLRAVCRPERLGVAVGLLPWRGSGGLTLRGIESSTGAYVLP